MNPIVRIKYYAQKVARQFWQKNDEEYVERIANELEAFDENENVPDLPEIFHYWSNKYLRPKLEMFGLTDPEQFFLHTAFDSARGRTGQYASLVSARATAIWKHRWHNGLWRPDKGSSGLIVLI